MEQYQSINNKYFYIEGLTDQGNRNENQDSYLIEEHPILNNTVIAAVFDGVGGEKYGKETSMYANYLFKSYFLDSKYFDEDTIRRRIHDIHYKIMNHTSGYTTLSLAILNPSYTYISNIGDSRIYTYNNKLKLITEDDSLVWKYVKEGKLSIDDLRFLKENNVITRCLGDYRLRSIDVKKIKTPKEMIITSDGVHDILSLKMLKLILKQYKDEDVVPKIILDSLTERDYIEEKASDYLLYHTNEPFNAKTYPGKDNTTVVLVKKKRPL